MKSFIKTIIICYLLICCFLTTHNAFTVQASTSSARAMIVIEQTSKRVLYEKNAYKPLAMASTTKIMTALTTLHLCSNLDEEVKIHPKSVGIPGTSIYLRKGETLTVKELLYGLMLPSGNDAAVALAYHASGSEEKFVAEMNILANKIGCTFTHFSNPHGLDERGHFTTAYDLAIIAAKALENKDFLEISMTKSIEIRGSKEGAKRFLKNKNKLVTTMEGCTGVKIGFTDDAGRCLVGSIDKNNFKAISVVLNCGPMFEESKVLLELATDQFKMVNLSNLISKTIQVENSEKTQVTATSIEDFYYPLTNEELENIKVEYTVPEKLVAPIEEGTLVGKVKVLSNGRLLFEKDLLIMEEAKPKQKPNATREILDHWF